jgi:zinc/manganese transport system permease protein
MFELLDFMKWPVVACLLLPPLLIYLGLHIIRREIIFVDLALAQVAALGTCVAVLLHHEEGWAAYIWPLGFTIAGAAIFTLTRTEKSEVPQEALIGIIYVVAAALGILLLSRSSEGDEALKRTLVGDVLLVNRGMVARNLVIYVVVGFVHFIFRRQFLAISFGQADAKRDGLKVKGWDFLFYCLFGVVVTAFVEIGGVLLTFSYLIVPAVCATFLARGLIARLVTGWLVAAGTSLGSLYLSFKFDLPTGAAIVCGFGVALLGSVVAARWTRR